MGSCSTHEGFGLMSLMARTRTRSGMEGIGRIVFGRVRGRGSFSRRGIGDGGDDGIL